MQDIDQILSSELDEPAPPALHAAVMRAVCLEAARPAPIAFPWGRFAVGLAAGVILCTLVALHASALAERL